MRVNQLWLVPEVEPRETLSGLQDVVLGSKGDVVVEFGKSNFNGGVDVFWVRRLVDGQVAGVYIVT